MNYERGYDPYNKRDVCPDWLANIPEITHVAGIIVADLIRTVRAEERRISQAIDAGYDPYNKAHPGRGYRWQPTLDSRPHPSHN